MTVILSSFHLFFFIPPSHPPQLPEHTCCLLQTEWHKFATCNTTTPMLTYGNQLKKKTQTEHHINILFPLYYSTIEMHHLDFSQTCMCTLF